MDHLRLRTLLNGLRGQQAEDAWREFIDEVWPILLKVVHHVERDRDDAADCFLYICEQLRNNGFARLRRFDPDGAARFTTWLELVASRLCVDWHRKRAGRVRALQSIARLTMLEQEVFRAVYEEGADLHTAWACCRRRSPPH
jgi:DNA-directed RNA polymerase specialized sigma24 family protein